MANKRRKIQNNISFIVDADGKETAMVISLKDKQMRAWAHQLQEDIHDIELIKKSMAENPNREGAVDFFEFAQTLLDSKHAEHV